jgi:putative phosphoesterase
MTRLALVSDQHGNDVAFKAVADDVERAGADIVVCLGDVAQGGAQPRETLERLKALGWRTILGNADAFLLEVPADSNEWISDRQLAVREWTLEQLDGSLRGFIRSFEPRIELDLDGVKIVCFHASPRHYEDLLLPDSEESALVPFLPAADNDLLTGGHTHRQWTRTIETALFVNPGSVGNPDDEPAAGIPLRADYAIVTIGDGGLAVDFKHSRYALDDLERATVSSGRPFAGSMLSEWQRSS